MQWHACQRISRSLHSYRCCRFILFGAGSRRKTRPLRAGRDPPGRWRRSHPRSIAAVHRHGIRVGRALGAPLDGRIVKVDVQIGQRVSEGDPLLTLDCPDAAEMRAAVASGTASLREAHSALDRQNRMMQQGVGTERDRIAAETRVSELEAELERVQADVTFIGVGSGTGVVLRSPINGIVISRRANVGMTVQKGSDPIVEVGDPSAHGDDVCEHP